MNALFLKKLQQLIDEHGWSQKEAAEKLKVSQGFLSEVLRGKKNLSFARITELATNAEVSPLFFFSEGQEKSLQKISSGHATLRRLPIISYEKLRGVQNVNDMRKVLEEAQEYITIADKEERVDEGGEMLVISIRGDSMSPRWREGDMAIAYPGHPLEQGKLTLLNVGNEILLKYATDRGDHFVLTSENSDKYPAFTVLKEKVLWAYRVRKVVTSAD